MHREIRRADVLGLAPASAFATGPARIADLARAISEGAETDPPAGVEVEKDADEKYVERLREKYADVIRDVWDKNAPDTWLDPFDDVNLRLFYVNKPYSVYNNQGRQLEDGFNLYVSDRVVLRAADMFVFTAQPELSFIETEDHGTNSETSVRFQELSASARWGGAEITVGRTPLWWGPGRHGSLLLSNNARAFDLLRVGSGGPQLLPGWLGYLGLVQAETFLTQLEESRGVSRPYLWGMRLTSRLNPYMEIGASRTAQFGGGDRSVDLGTLWNVVSASTENDLDDPGNQLASLDARVIIPWDAQPFELYTEVGGEDESNGFFSKKAYIFGLYLPRLGPCHLAELTFEFANTTVSGDADVWYTSRHYPDGYTYHERTIGHHVGTDGLDVFGELRLHPCDGLEVFLSFDYEEHRRRLSAVESVYQGRVGVEKRVWKSFWVAGVFGVDVWKNVGSVEGDDQVGYAIGLGGRWKPDA